MNVSITFCGGAGTVTGSNFLVEALPAQAGDGKKFLVDCGMAQGGSFAEESNRAPFLYEPSSIELLIVTHAHIDHVGRIPLLVKRGFRGIIYSTDATKELARELLMDAVSVMRQEHRERGTAVLYEESDVEKALVNWKTIPYHAEQKIPGGLSFSFDVSGHILGSSLVRLRPSGGGKTLMFTGDLGNPKNRILPSAEEPKGVSYLVMESVYGNRKHEGGGERAEKLESIARETIRRGGVLLIPAFATERTQDLLFDLHELMRTNRLPRVPVFVDSPLGSSITAIYRNHPELYEPELQARANAGEKIFAFPGLTFTDTREESRKIDAVRGPKIIIAGSGMSHGGRVLGHEARYLPMSATTLLIVGYQSAGSLGRRLEEGAKEVEIEKKKVTVRASVETIFGYSAHMDGDALLSFAEAGAETIKKIFVVMGEPSASLFLAQRLNGYGGLYAVVPERGEKVEVDL